VTRRLLLFYLAIIAALLAVVAFVFTQTEWVEIEVPHSARGEARTNPRYAVQQLLKELGGNVQQHIHLQTMPPHHARLLLDHNNWNMFGDRTEALRQWIDAGGHLVIGNWLVDVGAMDWLFADAEDDDDDEETDDVASQKSACETLTEAEDAPAYYGNRRSFQRCKNRPRSIIYVTEDKPLWRVDGPEGIEMLRISYGSGSVTILADEHLLANHSILEGDHALLAAAAFQAEPGAIYWFVTDESRSPLLLSLWRRLWPAIILAFVALALFIWRSAVRFGPVLLPPSVHRRSMREQVRGTGRFLYEHDRQALYTAQRRALDEAAGQHLPGWATLDTNARATALAQATGLPQQEWVNALQPQSTPSIYFFSLLERARRCLNSSPSHPHAKHFS